MYCSSDTMCKLQDLLQSFFTVTVAWEFSGPFPHYREGLGGRGPGWSSSAQNTAGRVQVSNRKRVLTCLWQQESKLNFLANENTIF